MMKILSAIMAVFLTACTTVYETRAPAQPAPQPQKSKYTQELEKFRAEVAEPKRVYPDDDKSMRTIQNCAAMFPRGSDGERLCLLRGMDRYVDHMTPPLSERYLQRNDEISVRVPKAAPPPPIVTAPPPGYGAQTYGGTGGSAIVDCRVDPTPPCYYPTEPQQPWPSHTPGAVR